MFWFSWHQHNDLTQDVPSFQRPNTKTDLHLIGGRNTFSTKRQMEVGMSFNICCCDFETDSQT